MENKKADFNLFNNGQAIVHIEMTIQLVPNDDTQIPMRVARQLFMEENAIRPMTFDMPALELTIRNLIMDRIEVETRTKK